ncbi:MAG: hypothetical protein AAF621_07165 [Pseudomonadota bacterium]
MVNRQGQSRDPLNVGGGFEGFVWGSEEGLFAQNMQPNMTQTQPPQSALTQEKTDPNIQGWNPDAEEALWVDPSALPS